MSEAPDRTDEDLARESRKGSLPDFEILVRRYQTRIYSFVLTACRNEADAREITQETFVRAFQAMDGFDPRLAFAPWLFTIARRKCIDHFRSRPPQSCDEAEVRTDENDPARLLERSDEARNLWLVARNSLPVAQYQALWLRYAEDMTIAQIALALGKTQTHIKVMLLRARHTLLRKLESASQHHYSNQPASIPSALAKGGQV